MSRFSGPQHKGALRELREKRRAEAEVRQENVRPENTRRYRLTAEPILEVLENGFDRS